MSPLITNNPYVVNGVPKLIPSFCIFADILGFREKTLKAYREKETEAFFNMTCSVVKDGVKQIQQDDQDIKDGQRRMRMKVPGTKRGQVEREGKCQARKGDR